MWSTTTNHIFSSLPLWCSFFSFFLTLTHTQDETILSLRLTVDIKPSDFRADDFATNLCALIAPSMGRTCVNLTSIGPAEDEPSQTSFRVDVTRLKKEIVDTLLQLIETGDPKVAEFKIVTLIREGAAVATDGPNTEQRNDGSGQLSASSPTASLAAVAVSATAGVLIIGIGGVAAYYFHKRRSAARRFALEACSRCHKQIAVVTCEECANGRLCAVCDIAQHTGSDHKRCRVNNAVLVVPLEAELGCKCTTSEDGGIGTVFCYDCWERFCSVCFVKNHTAATSTSHHTVTLRQKVVESPQNAAGLGKRRGSMNSCKAPLPPKPTPKEDKTVCRKSATKKKKTKQQKSPQEQDDERGLEAADFSEAAMPYDDETFVPENNRYGTSMSSLNSAHTDAWSTCVITDTQTGECVTIELAQPMIEPIEWEGITIGVDLETGDVVMDTVNAVNVVYVQSAGDSTEFCEIEHSAILPLQHGDLVCCGNKCIHIEL
eukprot:PhF_6_TR42432/c0_g1_i1/m.63998